MQRMEKIVMLMKLILGEWKSTLWEDQQWWFHIEFKCAREQVVLMEKLPINWIQSSH